MIPVCLQQVELLLQNETLYFDLVKVPGFEGREGYA